MISGNAAGGWESFYQASFDDARLREASAEVRRRHSWLLHETSFAMLASIREHGLQPRRVESSYAPTFLDAKGLSQELLCLRPVEFASVLSIGKPGPRVMLAVAGPDVPAHAGFDWTFPDSITMAEAYWTQSPHTGSGVLVSEIGLRYGSIAFYGAIAATSLRIRGKGDSPTDPANWPALLDADDAEVFHIPGDDDIMSMPDPLSR